MHKFVEVMNTLKRRFKSGNSVEVERTTIKRVEFEAIQAELSRLQAACHKIQNDN